MTSAATSPTTGGSEPRARVSNLSITFEQEGGDILALRGLSLEVQAGEILAVVGESGSGKSVLGLSLLGLLPSDPAPRIGGDIEVCGVDMVRAGPTVLRRVRQARLGAVFQDPMTSLNPSMRIGEQVIEATGSKIMALRLLDAVNFPGAMRRFHAYPHELSGGLRQRVMLAMALAGRPELIIADEPTTALDVTVQAQILALLKRIRDEFGTSFLFITHDLGVAAQIADRIAVVYGGRLLECGPTRELLGAPAHPYTIGLLRSRLTMQTVRGQMVVSLAGDPPDPRDPPPGCPFAPRCAHAIADCEASMPPLVARPDQSGEVACPRVGIDDIANDAGGEGVALPPQRAAETILRISGLSKTFRVRRRNRLWRDRLTALRNIDLEVVSGEALALVGESGCGKSTLLRAIAGLTRTKRRSITLAAEDRPQMVFQDAGASLTPWLTVGEQVGEALAKEGLSRAERRSRTSMTLQAVGLSPDLSSTKPGRLSGGQLQRVALARATIVPASLLLCDEPTSALDVSLVAAVLNILRGIRARFDTTLIFVTHDLAIARMVADRIGVMYLGRIIEIGPSEQVVEAPAHPYTRLLLASLPGLNTTLPEIEGEIASPFEVPTGCAFHPRCAHATDRCRRDDPELAQLATPAHAAACWHPLGATSPPDADLGFQGIDDHETDDQEAGANVAD